MNAQDLPVTQLLNGVNQFIVPIFQSTKHCQQLWADIMHVGLGANAKWHFLDAVVYVAAEENFSFLRDLVSQADVQAD